MFWIGLTVGLVMGGALGTFGLALGTIGSDRLREGGRMKMGKLARLLGMGLVLAMMLAAVPALAQAPDAAAVRAPSTVLKNEQDVEAFMVRVMSAIGRGDLDAAYTAAKNYSVLPGGELDAGLQASKTQRSSAQFLARYGKTIGYDLISRKELGQSMLRFVCIERTQKQPLPWTFHFYRSEQGWVLSEMGWDGNPAALYLSE